MLTSIIILTKNQLEYTKHCLESIRDYTVEGTYELIFVDNASDDGTREWLQAQKDIKLVLNDENLGFPKGCNQGIELATGDNILLLNNDTIVTENWLDNLITCLYSADDIGAVGPVSNNAAYYSTIPTEYTNVSEMQEFAKSYNKSNSSMWEQRVKLIGFCMLIKKSIVDQIGLLDERFTPGNYEDDDYSYRIQLMGYKLMICKDTFIHHYGSVSFSENKQIDHSKLLYLNNKKFSKKWGFNSTYSSMIRTEIVSLIDAKLDEEIKVLEVGCATGSTLLEIKNKYKNAKLFGIEINKNSAAIAQQFIDVKASNIEEDIEFPTNFFDYIIFADVLEHLYDPWKVLDNIRRYLKEDGTILISIPNVMHYTVIRDLMDGNWTYQDAGLLDRTHIRFFTLKELNRMLLDAYYDNINYSAIVFGAEDNQDQIFIDDIIGIRDNSFEDQYTAYQYLVKANKVSDKQVAFEKELNHIIEDIEFDVITEENQLRLINYILNDQININDVLKKIVENTIEPIKILLGLTLKSYDLKLDSQIVLSFIYTAYELDNNYPDTLYNLAYILASYGQKSDAINYLKNSKEMDKELQSLYNYLLIDESH